MVPPIGNSVQTYFVLVNLGGVCPRLEVGTAPHGEALRVGGHERQGKKKDPNFHGKNLIKRDGAQQPRPV
jgi:hypothetical protein